MKLEMKNISKSFGETRVLENVSLSVDTGEIHAICGENGAGKSTLMKILSGVYSSDTYSGEIFFEENNCNFYSINDSEE